MTYKSILVERDGPAFIIRFNRPDKRNAISTVVMDDLILAATEAQDDPSVRGIIVTGGDTFFSAGADLNDAQALSAPAETLKYLRKWHRVCRAFEENEKPVIAAIAGIQLCHHQCAYRYGSRCRGNATAAQDHRRRKSARTDV